MTTSHNSIAIDASPDSVFDVLDDPHAYPCWVVGTRRVRAVDPDWPAEGSRFHHALGTPAAELHDWSRICRRDRPRRLDLDVRFRPTGTARVELLLEPDGEGCRVELRETPVRGPAARAPGALVGPLLRARNWWSLRRLRRVIERAGPPSAPFTTTVRRSDAPSASLRTVGHVRPVGNPRRQP